MCMRYICNIKMHHLRHIRVGSICNRHRSEGFCYLGKGWIMTDPLSHRGCVTLTCASKLDHHWYCGLPHTQRQAIIRTNTDLLSNGWLTNKLHKNIDLKHVFEMSSANWWPFCRGINVICRDAGGNAVITMTLWWARCHLRSPPSRLFTQLFIQGTDQRNAKGPRHWPLWGEFTGDQWIPHTKGQ